MRSRGEAKRPGGGGGQNLNVCILVYQFASNVGTQQ